MHQNNHAGGSRTVNSQFAEHAAENLRSLGFPSSEDPAEIIHKAPPKVKMIQGLSLRPADEDLVHPLRAARADFLKGANLHACRPLAKLRKPIKCSLPLAPTQKLQVQMLYASDVDPAYAFGKEVVPALHRQGHNPNAISNSFGSNGNPRGFVSVAGPIPGTNTPFHHNNAAAQGTQTNTCNVPARNGINISISSLQLRGARSPPQPFEVNIEKLYDRLVYGGADIGPAWVLRFIIFANGVTYDALVAPIETPELLRASGGGTRMWGLLLEMKEMLAGKKKYRCLLCPLENRAEYRHNRDALRHFNKDHFGFSFPCEYW